MKGMPHAARLFLAILWAGSSVSPVWGAALAPHETIEWTWAEFPKSIDPALPDVLLEGDSITRNYYPEVAAELAGKANIFLFATSASVGDPRLSRQLADYSELAHRHFSVIHFSNGLHGWDIAEDRYEHGFPDYLKAIERIAPQARLIWTTTTPIRIDKDGGSNLRIAARNAVAERLISHIHAQEDDQHRLMTDHADLYQDDVHFGPAGSKIQAHQVARSIADALHLG